MGNCSDMNADIPSDEELLAYVDEQLETQLATGIEGQLRENPTLQQRLRTLLSSRDEGEVSIGEVWRHERLSCPSQTELGLSLVDAVDPALGDYIRFHVEEAGCVYCRAQLEEMRESTRVSAEQDQQRRRESLFASSAGLLSRRHETDPEDKSAEG